MWRSYHSQWDTPLEEWLTVAKPGGHTEKLRELLEQLRVACAGPPAPKPPVDWFYIEREGWVEGPFEEKQIAEWFDAGFLPHDPAAIDLAMRSSDMPANAFTPLSQMVIEGGGVPRFVSAHKGRLAYEEWKEKHHAKMANLMAAHSDVHQYRDGHYVTYFSTGCVQFAPCFRARHEHALRAVPAPESSLSLKAFKLTKHEDARVAKAAAAVIDYWRTLASVISQVPELPPVPAPAPVSNLRPEFFSKIFPNDVLALVLEEMSPRWYAGHRVSAHRRVRDLARLQRVCKGFRDAAALVLTPEGSAEAKAVEQAKREAEERARRAEERRAAEERRKRYWEISKAVAKAKAKLEAERAERERKETVERAIRYAEESAKRKPEALTEATACPELSKGKLRRHFRKGRLSQLKKDQRDEEAKARDEARKACAVGRYHAGRAWSEYFRWADDLRSDPLDYMW